MEELNFLVITVCVGEMVSILQTNPSRNVGNFTANYDITIACPVSIRNNYIGGTAIEKASAAIALHVN
jgi:hypothetical protein